MSSISGGSSSTVGGCWITPSGRQVQFHSKNVWLQGGQAQFNDTVTGAHTNIQVELGVVFDSSSRQID
jgi:hypothetical protein